MKIFLPFKKDANNYFDEIIRFSQTEFVFDDYKNYDSNFKIVNIHWPESIFDWKEFSIEDLHNLEEAILKWKKYAKIIYTVHNLKPHSGLTPNYEKLYKVIESQADYFIHLGGYSKIKFEKIYPKARHYVVEHPLYSSSFKVYDRKVARESLGIEADALVIISPGRIRNTAEKKMILNSFDSIKNGKKVLIVPNMYNKNNWNKFPGYYKLKEVIPFKMFFNRLKKTFLPPKYYFNYSYITHEKLALMMSASDIVLIPRIDILNSGNVFLGLTYKKIIVGPNQGNIKEHLEMFNFPIFNPKSTKSVKRAINDALNKLDNNFEIDSKKIESFLAINIAAKFDDLIKKISVK